MVVLIFSVLLHSQALLLHTEMSIRITISKNKISHINLFLQHLLFKVICWQLLFLAFKHFSYSAEV